MKNKEKEFSRRALIRGTAHAGLASLIFPLSGFSEPIAKENPIKDELQTLKAPNFEAYAVIYAPSVIYATEGVETNIYFDNILFSNLPNALLDIDITCIKGRQYEKFWRVTPTEADAETTSWKIDISFDGKIIASKTSELFITNSKASSGKSIKVLCIGDSTTAGGQYVSIVNTDYQSLASPSMTFFGTKGTAPDNHEGRGGWKFIQYAGDGGVSTIKFNLKGVDEAPGLGAVYSNNQSEFTVSEINLDGKNGYISAKRTKGTSNPTLIGKLNKISGVGAAIVPYLSIEIVYGNPFWNSQSQRLDFKKYLKDNRYTLNADDLITVHLGINDVFNGVVSIEKLESIKTDFNKMIDEFRSVIPNINIGLCLTIPPSISQDAFAISYANGQSLNGYMNNYKQLVEFLIKNYDTSQMRASKLYCLGFNHCIDRTNNFNKALMPANSRSTKIIDTWVNGVHPDKTGYYQMGDALYSFIRNLHIN